jgi:hypothetical protein
MIHQMSLPAEVDVKERLAALHARGGDAGPMRVGAGAAKLAVNSHQTVLFDVEERAEDDSDRIE